MDDSATVGLTQAEVEERVARGQTNAVKEVTSRSYWHIIRANVFTRFNAILGTLFIVILIFGQLRDGLFGLVILVNTLIGIIQEIRAKRTLDRLSLISAPKTRVVRDSQSIEIPLDEVVLDDVIELRTGDQVIADGAVLTSEGLEVDESLLTGESVPVDKVPGDEVRSGSFVIAGSGRFLSTKVGADSYARKLTAEARRFQLVSSELRDGINKILRVITWVMVPTGTLLFISQLRVFDSFGRAVPGTVAGLVGMVPEGLILLTSVAFAVSVITLGRRNVLVQELPAVEALARVDVVCLDKTGTLTEGVLVFNRLVAIDSQGDLAEVLGAFGADAASHSTTLDAIASTFAPPEGWNITERVPFSSIRKWSAETFGEGGTWVLGAPEVLLEKVSDSERLRSEVDELAGSGLRVLMLARAGGGIVSETLPDGLKPSALLLFEEKVRSDAADTLKYFTDQGVSIKVISGDNPETVAAVANRTGVPDVGEPVDARRLPEGSEDLARVMDERTVFGRVTPDQKESMVEALQSRGHVVAMTGDGVNDALALKKADVGIAMGSGSPASKAVAQLVLLDGKFATLPGVVAEGRRVIGNIERVANLFLTKTVYATLLSIIIGLAGWAFIFLPRHLTLISAVTIGTPAFFLSLAPNKARYRPGFVKRVLRFTVPAGVVAAVAAFAAGALSHVYSWINISESRTAAILVLAIIGLWVLGVLARPFTFWKAILVMAMVLGLLLAVFVPFVRDFLALNLPSFSVFAQTLGIAAVAIVLIEIAWRFTGWRPRGDLHARLPRVLGGKT
jgi:cation-transporting ATPase E